MPTVWIPSLMRDLTNGEQSVVVEGATVRQVIRNLEAAYPGIRERLMDGDDLRRGIGVAIDGIFTRRGLMEQVPEDAEVHFLPAVSGGSSWGLGLRPREVRSEAPRKNL